MNSTTSYTYIRSLTTYTRNIVKRRKEPVLAPHGRGLRVYAGPLVGANNQISLAKTLWSQVIKVGDIVIDATAGNGHDSLELYKLVGSSGKLYYIDVQDDAVKATTNRILSYNTATSNTATTSTDNFIGYCSSHEFLPAEILPNTVKCVVYNLGYLPGGGTINETRIATQTSSTIESIKKALVLIKKGGLISVLCYRGHSGGLHEQESVEQLILTLDAAAWRVTKNENIGVPFSPILYIVYRRDRIAQTS